MSESALLQQLRQTGDPALALQLLAISRSREAVEAALRTLETEPLDDRARPVLRAKFDLYASGKLRDSAALVREKIVRLLSSIGHPDDADIYLRGVNTYEAQPVTDVTQGLRAASLVALALVNADLAAIYATKLLGELSETSAFNGEPAITAINLLAQQGHTLAIYQFVLLAGMDVIDSGHHETLGKALESLGPLFPVPLYTELVDLFGPRDRALVNMGLITHIVEQRITELYARLENLISSTRHDELHRYGVVMLAAARDDTLAALLFRLAQVSPPHRRANFIEALELVPGEKAQEIIRFLSEQMRK